LQTPQKTLWRIISIQIATAFVLRHLWVLIEVPVMLMLVKICIRTEHWFEPSQKAVQG